MPEVSQKLKYLKIEDKWQDATNTNIQTVDYVKDRNQGSQQKRKEVYTNTKCKTDHKREGNGKRKQNTDRGNSRRADD